jgi:hypothetical protein
MEHMTRELVWVRAELGRQRDYALTAFSDQDHAEYVEQHLLPVAQELEAANTACLVEYVPHLEQGACLQLISGGAVLLYNIAAGSCSSSPGDGEAHSMS